MSAFTRVLKFSALFVASSFLVANAQTYPTRTISIIVPYPPGGGTDSGVRPLVNAVSEILGQPVIVDNRPGGNTFIGMNACAKAPPDGYTLCVTNADSLAFGPYVFNRIPYDPVKDLVGVTKLVTPPNGLFISGQLPYTTLKQVVDYAKSNPGKLNFGTYGAGTGGHMYVEWFRHKLKTEMTHVPYRGAAPIIPALINNEVQISWLALPTVLPHLKTGRIKAIALDAPTRSAQVPDVPTLAELNSSPNIQTYLGLYAPAGTPAAVIARLNAAFSTVLRDPRTRENLSGLLFEPTPSTSDEINRSRREEAENARRLTSDIGLKPLDLPE